jgi:hypothetical protein
MQEFVTTLEPRRLFSVPAAETALIKLMRTRNPNIDAITTEITAAWTATTVNPPSTLSEMNLATVIQKAIHTAGLPEAPAKRMALLLMAGANGGSLSSTTVTADVLQLRATLEGAGIAYDRVKPISADYDDMITIEKQTKILTLSSDLKKSVTDGDTVALVDRIQSDINELHAGIIQPDPADVEDLAVSMGASLQKHPLATVAYGKISYDLQMCVNGGSYTTNEYVIAKDEFTAYLEKGGVDANTATAITAQMDTLYLGTGGTSTTNNA